MEIAAKLTEIANESKLRLLENNRVGVDQVIWKTTPEIFFTFLNSIKKTWVLNNFDLSKEEILKEFNESSRKSEKNN